MSDLHHFGKDFGVLVGNFGEYFSIEFYIFFMEEAD